MAVRRSAIVVPIDFAKALSTERRSAEASEKAALADLAQAALTKAHYSAYKSWCDRLATFTSAQRTTAMEALEEIGPLPPWPQRPAHLDEVWEMAQQELEAVQDADGAFEEEKLPRTFAGECCRILEGRKAIDTFNAEQVYRRCTLFRNCSPGFINALIEAGGDQGWRGKPVSAGINVYTEGEPGSSMFIIVRGNAVEVMKGVEEKTLGPGDHCGAAQALGVSTRRQETVRASTSLHVIEIPCRILMQLSVRPLRLENKEHDADGSGSVPLSRRPDGRIAVAFAAERRHFEREAKLIASQLKSHRRRRPAARLALKELGLQTARLGSSELNEEEDSELPDASSSIGSRPFPRRLVRPGTQATAATAELEETITATEQLIQQVRASIRRDMWSGFLQPDLPGVRAGLRPSIARRSRARRTLAIEAPTARPHSQSGHHRTSKDMEEEDIFQGPEDEPKLDLTLFPPVSEMCAKQKVTFLRLLQRKLLHTKRAKRLPSRVLSPESRPTTGSGTRTPRRLSASSTPQSPRERAPLSPGSRSQMVQISESPQNEEAGRLACEGELQLPLLQRKVT